MSQESSPVPASSLPPAPPARRSPLPAGAVLIGVLALMVVFGAVVLNRPPAPAPPATAVPTGAAGRSPTVRVAVSTASPSGPAAGVHSATPSAVAGMSGTGTPVVPGTLAVGGIGGTGTPGALVTATIGLGIGTPAVAISGTMGLGTSTPAALITGTAGLGTGTPAAISGTLSVSTGTPAAAISGTMGSGTSTPAALITGTVGLGTGTPAAALSATRGLGTATPAAALPAALHVLEVEGTVYLCPDQPGCSTAAAANSLLPLGSEARTALSSTLRLQTAAGLLTLAGDSTVRVARLDAAGTGLTLTHGRVLLRAAAGRSGALAVTAGGATVTGTGSSFSVAVLPDGGTRVSVPADAPRPVAVQTGPAGSPAADLGPGKTLTLAADGTVTLGPIDPTEIAALVALGGGPPATPAAVAAITVLPVPTLAAPLPGVVTATIVLTPPAEQTLPPVTVVAGTAPTAAASVPTVPPADVLGLAVTAMSTVGNYTFGATLGADPTAAEFSAGTWSGDSACWISTGPSGRSDYQWRSGLLFRRNGTAAWQQQAGGNLPPWITLWRVLGQIDPTTVSELPPQQLDAVTVRRLRAHLLPASGYPAGTWADVTVGAADSLVRSVILYDAEPGSGHTILKIGFSSLGSAAPCPPLSAP